MTALAFSPGEVISSETLAASVNTNPVVVRRLLLGLRRARLIDTFTGKHGGARLRKNARQISLVDIYDAIEPGPVVPINERRVLKKCHVSCHMKSIMTHVAESTEDAIRSQLRRTSLVDLVRKIPPRH